MKNIRNYGIVTGRLVRDPKICSNRDGSRKILFTIAAQDNYIDKNGRRTSQFISLEAFVSGKQKDNGVYAYVNGGDLVTCAYSVQSNIYKNKDGNTVYGQVLLVNDVVLLESKAVKEARQAKTAKATQKNTAKQTKRTTKKQTAA